jgi:hypothetical protein
MSSSASSGRLATYRAYVSSGHAVQAQQARDGMRVDHVGDLIQPRTKRNGEQLGLIAAEREGAVTNYRCRACGGR